MQETKLLQAQQNLKNTEYVREGGGGGEDGRNQSKHVVCRSVREQLQVIWSVLVMRRDEERHEVMEKHFAGLVVGEQRVSVHMVPD